MQILHTKVIATTIVHSPETIYSAFKEITNRFSTGQFLSGFSSDDAKQFLIYLKQTLGVGELHYFPDLAKVRQTEGTLSLRRILDQSPNFIYGYNPDIHGLYTKDDTVGIVCSIRSRYNEGESMQLLVSERPFNLSVFDEKQKSNTPFKNFPEYHHFNGVTFEKYSPKWDQFLKYNGPEL
jgi:hypothetical protein